MHAGHDGGDAELFGECQDDTAEDSGGTDRQKIYSEDGDGGTLTDADRAALWGELEAAGITGITLDGTTTWQVDYGEPVVLQIQGTLGSGYEFTEKRVSTAKH